MAQMPPRIKKTMLSDSMVLLDALPNSGFSKDEEPVDVLASAASSSAVTSGRLR
jgi:hypothetical protein